MRAQPSDDPRFKSLRALRALHPHPERVQDETFRSDDFFDPRDLLQVRYEMLRRHRIEGKAVSAVARSFGFSRQAFYVTEAHFRTQGLAGLLPRRRGPRRAHKCTDEILDFVEQWRPTADGQETVVEAVRRRFGVRINARSIERAMKRRKKNWRPKGRHKANVLAIRSRLSGGSIRSTSPTCAGDRHGGTPGTGVGAFSGPGNAGLAHGACGLGALRGKARSSEREQGVAG